MDIAKMLNVTILACLLILTGCFGLGAVDDDVIDDADGADTGTTVVNTYPPVQSMMKNETITVAAGEYVEVLSAYYYSQSNLITSPNVQFDMNCNSSIDGSFMATSTYSTNWFLPSNGGDCTYTNTYSDNIIYRVWS